MAGDVRVRAPDVQRLLPRLAAEGIEATVIDGDELLVRSASSARVGQVALEAGIALHELAQDSSTLEKVYLELTSEKAP